MADTLFKDWLANCTPCGQAQHADEMDLTEAKKALHRMGWVTRGGHWVCPRCAPDYKRGEDASERIVI